MPRKKKTARDMTTEELAKRVFPKKVLEQLRKIAHENDKDMDYSSQKQST